MKLLYTPLAASLAAAATVEVVNAQATRPTLDIPSTAVNAGIFTTLVAALDVTNLIGPLSTPNGPYTVFAPTDDSFSSLPNGLVSCLLEDVNNQILTDILLYHVVSGQVLSTQLTDGMIVPTLLDGENVIVDLTDGVKINDSTVVSADVLATNGVIHVINQVLIPPSIDVAAFLETCAGVEPTTLVDIPSTAIVAGVFTTLVAALGAADLVGAISDPNGPFTVFAPTDDAFDALPEGLVSCLLDEENKDALSSILLYHVVSGKVLSTDLSDGMMTPTLQGEDVIVDINSVDGTVKINDSNVIIADVLATNGAIHVIDAVLVPPSIDVIAFLESCDSDDNDDNNKCTYLGESRLVGQYLVGSTQTCLCASNGLWIDCQNNNAVVDNNNDECTYLGKSRSVGQYLIGPTHTCLCTSGGHWINCKTNSNNNNGINTPVVVAEDDTSTNQIITPLDDSSIKITLAESTTKDEESSSSSSSSLSSSTYSIGSITTIIIGVAGTALLL